MRSEVVKHSAKVVAEIRSAADLTQEEMANEIGVSDRTISHYERGRRVPTPDHAIGLVKLTKRFGLKKGKRPYCMEDIYRG